MFNLNGENVESHTHNGSDSDKLSFKTAIREAFQPAITKPTGGSVVDIQARAAIDTIIDTLKTIGITL